MNQEEVWDEIGRPWKDFRVKVPPTVEKFLSDKSGKILDVGCGSGRNFLKMDGVFWYGIDFSGEMLKYAEETAKAKGVRVCLTKALVDSLPYEDDFFDAVLFYAVLHCVDSVGARKKALEEIYRVLKVRGEALISVWGSKSPRLRGKGKECFVPWTVRDEGEKIKRKIENPSLNFCHPEKIKRYTYVYDLEELLELCESVGFEVLECWEERNVNLIVRKG